MASTKGRSGNSKSGDKDSLGQFTNGNRSFAIIDSEEHKGISGAGGTVSEEYESLYEEENGRSNTHSVGKSRRGFAAMDPEVQKEIASMGGKAAHGSGHAHEWNSDEAREAGRRGAKVRWRDDKL
jgi:uncharacterized protein